MLGPLHVPTFHLPMYKILYSIWSMDAIHYYYKNNKPWRYKSFTPAWLTAIFTTYTFWRFQASLWCPSGWMSQTSWTLDYSRYLPNIGGMMSQYHGKFLNNMDCSVILVVKGNLVKGFPDRWPQKCLFNFSEDFLYSGVYFLTGFECICVQNNQG